MWWDNRCLSGHVNNSMLKQLWGLPQILLLLCSRLALINLLKHTHTLCFTNCEAEFSIRFSDLEICLNVDGIANCMFCHGFMTWKLCYNANTPPLTLHTF